MGGFICAAVTADLTWPSAPYLVRKKNYIDQNIFLCRRKIIERKLRSWPVRRVWLLPSSPYIHLPYSFFTYNVAGRRFLSMSNVHLKGGWGGAKYYGKAMNVAIPF
jgi:hypothetical protein